MRMKKKRIKKNCKNYLEKRKLNHEKKILNWKNTDYQTKRVGEVVEE
jgi:hypothetical protein